MTQKQDIGPAGDEEPVIPYELRRAMQVAIRLAATLDGAPALCPRRQCRNAMRCQVSAWEPDDGGCAPGLTEKAHGQVALMLAFLGALAREYRLV